MKIFLLEDDIALQSSIRVFLESKGFQVASFNDGESAFEALDEEKYALYLLDINVPGMDGLKLLELIRVYNSSAKVLMISATSDIDTISKAYKLGSVDYLKKPFYIEELYYKIQVMVQMVATQVQMLPTTQPLTKKERLLLELLVQRVGQSVAYEEIEERVYGGIAMTHDALRGVVKRLRKKIKGYVLKGVSGVGYMLQKRE